MYIIILYLCVYVWHVNVSGAGRICKYVSGDMSSINMYVGRERSSGLIKMTCYVTFL